MENTNINNQVIYENTQVETTPKNQLAATTANYMQSFPTIQQGLVQKPKPKANKTTKVKSTPLIDKSTAVKRGNPIDNNSIEGNNAKANKVDDNNSNST